MSECTYYYSGRADIFPCEICPCNILELIKKCPHTNKVYVTRKGCKNRYSTKPIDVTPLRELRELKELSVYGIKGTYEIKGLEHLKHLDVIYLNQRAVGYMTKNVELAVELKNKKDLKCMRYFTEKCSYMLVSQRIINKYDIGDINYNGFDDLTYSFDTPDSRFSARDIEFINRFENITKFEIYPIEELPNLDGILYTNLKSFMFDLSSVDNVNKDTAKSINNFLCRNPNLEQIDLNLYEIELDTFLKIPKVVLKYANCETTLYYMNAKNRENLLMAYELLEITRFKRVKVAVL
jgi:hypothetical protein